MQLKIEKKNKKVKKAFLNSSKYRIDKLENFVIIIKFIKYEKEIAGIKLIQSDVMLGLIVAFLIYVATNANIRKVKGVVPRGNPTTTSLIKLAKNICPVPITCGYFNVQK